MPPEGHSAAEETATANSKTAALDRGHRASLKRGPYRAPAARSKVGDLRPSCALAQNIRGYRLLRGMTQDQLATRMTVLGHKWGRSVVSAVEGGRRGVTIDEVFGLAISFGVTVGCLLDPSGPDRTRDLGLDVGLGHVGPLSSQLGRLFAASRAVIRLVDEDTGMIDIDMVSDATSASAHELAEPSPGVGSPLRRHLTTRSGA